MNDDLNPALMSDLADAALVRNHLESEIARLKEQIAGLVEALKKLMKIYVCNQGSKHEFIACVTPPGSFSMTEQERKDCNVWQAWDLARAALAKAEQSDK